MRQIRLAEVLGGLSFALDLTEGQPGGHILRTTLIGMALGERVGLAEPEVTVVLRERHAPAGRPLTCASHVPGRLRTFELVSLHAPSLTCPPR